MLCPCQGPPPHTPSRHGLLLPVAGVTCPERLPQPCSVQHLVSRYLDIARVPRRSFFELLACLSPHELEREKLLEFSSAEGQEALHDYCNRPRRTVLEVRVGGLAGGQQPGALCPSHTCQCRP